jgi:proteasome lid subunit RPN8/RPN11
MSKSEWVVDDDNCYKNCDHIDKLPQHKIVIGQDLWKIFKAMLKKFPNDEWQMLLIGEVKEDSCYVSDYYITKQEVGSAVVTHKDEITIDDIKAKGYVAGIHSHVSMPVNASTTDIEDSIMSPIPYHIIINNKLEVAGYRKATLPCGGFVTADCEVFVEGEIDLDSIEIRGLENITKKTYATGGVVYDHTKNDNARVIRRGYGYNGYDGYDDEKMNGYAGHMGWSE